MAETIVWVTGRSGAGKTTFGNNAKAHLGFKHFDGDVFSCGGNPLLETGIPTKEMLDNRNEQTVQLYEQMVEEGFTALFRGEDPPIDAWRPYITHLCSAVRKAWDEECPGKKLIVSFSVYPLKVRDLIRELLPGIKFVILNTEATLLADRKIAQVHDACRLQGKTFDELMQQFGKAGTTVEEAHREIVKTARGFEPYCEGELNAIGIDVTPDVCPAEVLKKSTPFMVGEQ
eukprot:GDKH01023961.1.p1 GENE.GDKH01023961.1~~GDKH01023961.1.p1  ORF type:complete len:230 (+),score=29.94 GDKH01023961.1:91-780(+)